MNTETTTEAVAETTTEAVAETTTEAVADESLLDTSAADESTGDLIAADDTVSDDTPAEIEYTDFNLPDGMELDTGLLELATPLFKEAKLDQETAQKFVDFQAQYVKKVQDEQIAQFETTKQSWKDEVKAHPEIGGDNFTRSISESNAAFKKFTNPELTSLVKDYGLGNHIGFIKLFKQLHSLTSEDSPGSIGVNSNRSEDRAERMYPNMKVEK